MLTFTTEISHHLSFDEAFKRMKESFFSRMKKDYWYKISNLNEEWNGSINKFNFSTMGFSINSTLIVTSSTIGFSSKIPFAAIPFKEKVENLIKELTEKILI